jgi:DNA polymerase I-like protein with 3'-5' exonuclease and polymerase domains
MNHIAVDFETTDLSGETILGVAVHGADVQWSAPWNQDTKRALQQLANTHTCWFHNALFDVFTVKHGISFPDWKDTMLGAHCWDSHLPSYGLDAVCDYFKIEGKLEKPIKFEVWNHVMARYCEQDARATYQVACKLMDTLGKDDKAWKHFNEIILPYVSVLDELRIGCPINLNRVIELREPLRAQINQIKEDAKQLVGLLPSGIKKYSRFVQFDGPMEKVGGKWVFTPLNPLDANPRYPRVGYFKRKGELKYDHCILKDFNIASTQQCINYLIKEYQWEPEEFTDTGNPSLDRDVIKELPEEWPLVPLLLDFSMLSILSTNFLEKFEMHTKHAVAPNGTPFKGLFSRFNPTGTKTGRLTSTKPNLANIPGADKKVGDRAWGADIRSCFKAPDGHLFVGADLSNFEARAFAYYASRVMGRDGLAAAFRNGVDFHSRNMIEWGLMELLGLPESTQVKVRELFDAGEDVQFSQDVVKVRKVCKRLLFGSLYGSGPKKAGNGDVELGKKLQAQLSADTGFGDLKDTLINQAKKRGGLVYSRFGRRLWYPALTEKGAYHFAAKLGLLDGKDDYQINREVKKQIARATRQIFNALLQSCNADVIEIIGVELHPHAVELQAWQCLSIYDELLYCVPEKNAIIFSEHMKKAFNRNDIFGDIVPVTGEVKIGKTWLEVH